jgi:hypothetical protein
MAVKWHDLYSDGLRLEYIIKQLNKKFKKYTKADDEAMMLTYADSIRKITMDKVNIAKVVLGVEDVINRGKKEIIRR